tara:strand:+ start:469 stop:1656 length:1188 start_codon:yes stop_codon:yes gene_type:complete
MKVGAAIYSMLKDDSAVAALVGTRIYPELAEEGAATPYVVYSVVSNTPVDTKESAPVDEAQLEVFSVADTYAAANDLADKVRAALARKGKKVYGTVTVQSVKYTNEVTEVSAERNMYISVQDYTARLTPVIPNLLLEQYPGAHAAYSLRRVRGEYTGPAVRLRRSNDSEELDIGFDSDGNLDIAACDAFFNGSNLTVKKYYDQSGNGNDVTQSTNSAQPLLYNTSGLIALDGRPVLQFLGNDAFPFDNTGLDIGSLSAFAVGKFQDTADTEYLLAVSGNAGGDKRFQVPVLFSSNFNYAYGGNVSGISTTANTSKNLHTMIAGSTQGNAQAFINGSNLGSLDLASGIDTEDSGIGSLNGFGHLDGYIQEVIIYGSDQSANRTGIESNIMTHYSIT